MNATVDTSDVEHSDSQDDSRRKRARSSQACEFCRSRKTKCDGQRPCGNCKIHRKVCRTLPKETRPRPNNATIAALRDEVAQLRRRLGEQAPLTGRVSQIVDESTVPPEVPTIVPSRTSPSTVPDPPVSSIPAPQPTAFGADVAPSNVFLEQPEPFHLQLPASPGRMDQEEHFSPAQSTNRIHAGGDGGGTSHGPTSVFFDAYERDYHSSPRRGGTSATPCPSSTTRRIAQGALTARELLPTDDQRRNELMAKAGEARHRERIDLARGRYDFDGWPSELVMHLLELHWNRQHHAFLVTYRPLFMRDWACNGPYYSKLLLNAILFGVAKFSDRPEVYDDPSSPATAGRGFLRRVKSLLGDALDKSRITTVQALLLLSSSLGALGEHGSGWMYSGIALRMITDLGLHFDAANRPGITSEDLEIRRRVVWGAFVLDKIHSLYQGRAVTLQEQDLHVPPTFLDYYEELEEWRPYAFPYSDRTFHSTPSYSISTFKQLCSLSVIMGRIINEVYTDRLSRGEPPESHLRKLDDDLRQWKLAIPDYLLFEPEAPNAEVPTPTLLSLHALYHTLVILLHRPFVETGHLHTQDPAIATSSWNACVRAASMVTKLLIAYRSAFTLRRAPYLISYITYVAATIHVRVLAADQSCHDPAFRESRQALRVCLDALEENAKTNAGTSKARSIIQGLMAQIGVQVPQEDTSMVPTDLFETPTFNEADLEMIIRSFGTNRPQAVAVASVPSAATITNSSGQQPLQDPFGPPAAQWQGYVPQQAIPPDTLFGYMHMPLWDEFGAQVDLSGI